MVRFPTELTSDMHRSPWSMVRFLQLNSPLICIVGLYMVRFRTITHRPNRLLFLWELSIFHIRQVAEYPTIDRSTSAQKSRTRPCVLVNSFFYFGVLLPKGASVNIATRLMVYVGQRGQGFVTHTDPIRCWSGSEWKICEFYVT